LKTHLALGACLCCALTAPLQAGDVQDISGLKAEQILVVKPERALDVPDPAAVNPVLRMIAFGIIPGLVASAVTEGHRKKVRLRQRETIRPLAEDPRAQAVVEAFRTELAEVVGERYAATDAHIQTIDGEPKRRRAELKLVPQSVLSAIVVSDMNMRLECFQFGAGLSYGTGYMKKTMDIRRRPIEVYVSRPERVRAVISEWCDPSVRALGRDGLDAQETASLMEQALPNMQRAREEVLEVLRSDAYDSIDTSVPTHRIRRRENYSIVGYHADRTLVASADLQLLKWVPSARLTALTCGMTGCDRLLQAQAAERERRHAWEASQGAG
jgi:hypothetical protein